MEFDLRFTDKEITAWGGMGIMKRMLDHLGFNAALVAVFGVNYLDRSATITLAGFGLRNGFFLYAVTIFFCKS